MTLCFGGGVLLATVLLHMLKEVREVLDEAAGLGALPEALEEYPFAELMVGAGKLSLSCHASCHRCQYYSSTS